MKWIGQQIYDQISRFRSDVYIENLSTTTETEVLVVDSTGKVSKNTIEDLHHDTSSQASVDNSGSTYIQDVTLDTYGHVTALTSTAIPTLNQDTTGEAATVATIAGLAPNTATTQATQPNIATCVGLTSIGAAGATTDFAAGDITMYNAVNDGNPTFSIGSSATERLEIKAEYESGAQGLDLVRFTTFTAGSGGDDGRYAFEVDDAFLLNILDGGLRVKASGFLEFGSGNQIISDSGGTTTLKNIDALDATTEATIESAIDTLANLTSLGSAGVTTNIVAGDVTMYNAVNDGNPTISLGSSATNRFEIKSLYNSSAQTLDSVDFTSYTTSGTTHDARYRWFVDEVELARMLDTGFYVYKGRLQVQGEGATLHAYDPTASSATEGGALRLSSDDGAAMADNHRLGIITFEGAEDASSNLTVGAQIEAFCEAGWSASENGARMVFSTTDGNASTSTVLTLDSNKLATFSGAVNIQGSRSFINSMGTDGAHDGDVVYFGGTTSMTVGKIYHYKSDGTWEIANADAVATSDGLLGVALGAASDTNGMLLRGMVTLDHDPGAIGDVLYVQSDNAGVPGNATATAPSVSGDCVRIIGYQVVHAGAGIVWFNPDNTFVEVA